MQDGTGKGLVDLDQENYFCDHYALKKWKQPVLWAKENVSLLHRPSSDLNVRRKGLAEMFRHATRFQTAFIGVGHEFAYVGEVAIDIVTPARGLLGKCTRADQLEDWMKTTALILALYELYENPLGGLNYKVWDVLSHLFSKFAPAFDKVELMLASELSGCGLNGQYSEHMLALASFIKLTREITRVADNDAIDFVVATSRICFVIGKGNFRPDATSLEGREQLELALSWLNFNPELRATLAGASLTVALVEAFLLNVIPALNTDAQIDSVLKQMYAEESTSNTVTSEDEDSQHFELDGHADEVDSLDDLQLDIDD